MIPVELRFNLYSSNPIKSFIRNYAKFKNPNLLQVSGTSNVFLIVDDQSNSGYTFLDNFREYLPPAFPDLKVSIFDPAVDNCITRDYCLYPIEILKFNPFTSYSFEISGNASSFVIDLTTPDIKISGDKITILPSSNISQNNYISLKLPCTLR